jgi:hypothetical protein
MDASWMKRLLVRLGSLDKGNQVGGFRPVDRWRRDQRRPGLGLLRGPANAADFCNSVFVRDVELPSLLAPQAPAGVR